MCHVLVGALLLALSACASLQPLTEGSAAGLTWHTADVALARKTLDVRSWWEYSFSLVVKETRGTALTFNEIKTTAYQPGINPWSPTYRGVWELAANDTFRIPLSVSLSCPHVSPGCTGNNVPIPLWRITMIGHTAGGEPVRYVIDLRMPADPPAPSPVTATDVRAIDLVAPRAPAAHGSPPAGKK
jgi:hypothetical protein